MNHHSYATLVAGALLFTPAAAADAARGQEMAAACAGCHGDNGNSKTENVPSLAGHPAPYLVVQLILFREQQRHNDVMTPLAKALSDQDIENLAAYFSKHQRVPADAPLVSPKADRGKTIADAGRCGACHLPDYSGREQIPRLAAQREDYLVKTMRDYKAGKRSGLDGMMTSVLYNYADDDLAALAAYLARLP
ncbi:MAG TPA: c-type cytochrome [Beijerinckiaceae bacterium]|nr:c-type cytochrome [Beijerinckiaceae bacterium]